MRRLSLAHITAADIVAARRRVPLAFALPAGMLARRIAWWALFLGFVLECLIQFDFSPARIFGGLSGAWTILRLMIPPVPGEDVMELVFALGETLAMAFLGTLIATILAIPIGFLAAKNVIPGWILHFSLRRLLDGIRGIDTLIWALVFVRAVGLGPLAGILAIAVSDTSSLSKLFAEAIETADPKSIDGIASTGARTLQVLRFGIVPQVIPVILSQALYFFESNTRSSTILGIVGAGGIGLQLSERIKVNEWGQACFVILMILVTVAAIDTLSRAIRMRLLGGERR